jgi:hypothetical protein
VGENLVIVACLKDLCLLNFNRIAGTMLCGAHRRWARFAVGRHPVLESWQGSLGGHPDLKPGEFLGEEENSAHAHEGTLARRQHYDFEGMS